jgi:hypothetical protein
VRVRVVLKRLDLLEGQQEVLLEGEGSLEGDRLSCPGPGGTQEVRYERDRVILESQGEVHSRLELPQGRPGTALIHSRFGSMRLAAVLIDRGRQDTQWQVEYELRDQDRVLEHFRLIWQILPLK